MPVLILLNGIPASGKSTLARLWCERHSGELPLALDVDVVRSLLGGWGAALQDAGHAARRLALAMADAHLSSGRDVIVPQYLRRPQFIEALEATAAAAGGVFVECVLSVDHREAEQRFSERAAAATSDRHGTLDQPMARVAAEFDAFVRQRSGAVTIGAGPGALDALDAAARRG